MIETLPNGDLQVTSRGTTDYRVSYVNPGEIRSLKATQVEGDATIASIGAHSWDRMELASYADPNECSTDFAALSAIVRAHRGQTPAPQTSTTNAIQDAPRVVKVPPRKRPKWATAAQLALVFIMGFFAHAGYTWYYIHGLTAQPTHVPYASLPTKPRQPDTLPGAAQTPSPAQAQPQPQQRQVLTGPQAQVDQFGLKQ